jgi:hypothetical protein
MHIPEINVPVGIEGLADDKFGETGTPDIAYEEKGPYHCEDCIHRVDSDSDVCIHPLVVIAPSMQNRLVRLEDGGGYGVKVNLPRGCCKYVNQDKE